MSNSITKHFETYGHDPVGIRQLSDEFKNLRYSSDKYFNYLVYEWEKVKVFITSLCFVSLELILIIQLPKIMLFKMTLLFSVLNLIGFAACIFVSIS
jgi:hypothetical protein